MSTALAPKDIQRGDQLSSISPRGFHWFVGDELHHFCVRNKPGVKTYLYSSVPLPVITKWHKSQQNALYPIEILQWVASAVGGGLLFGSFQSSLKASQKSPLSLDSLIFWCCTRWKSMQATQTKKQPSIFNLRRYSIVSPLSTLSSQSTAIDFSSRLGMGS